MSDEIGELVERQRQRGSVVDDERSVRPAGDQKEIGAVTEVARVLHILGGMDRAGVETLLMSIYRAIDRTRLQFDFLVSAQRECDYDREIAALGGRIFHVPLCRHKVVHYGATVYRLMKRERFCGVHSHVHAFSGVMMALANAAGVPVRVSHSHATHRVKAESFIRPLYERVMRALIVKHATHLICTAKPSGEVLYGRSCWRDARVRIVPNAIDLGAYEVSADRLAARRDLGLPLGGVVVGHIGRFHELKNHALLLRIFQSMRASGIDARLVVVGRGELQDDFIRRVAECGLSEYVYPLGVRGDVPRVLAAMDLFLFPSLSEGLGLVVIEAQAAGIPVVASTAVPPEADLRIDLLRRLPTNASLTVWLQAVRWAIDQPPVQWEDRKSALVRSGYDINDVAALLQAVYLKSTSSQPWPTKES